MLSCSHCCLHYVPGRSVLIPAECYRHQTDVIRNAAVAFLINWIQHSYQEFVSITFYLIVCMSCEYIRSLSILAIICSLVCYKYTSGIYDKELFSIFTKKYYLFRFSPENNWCDVFLCFLEYAMIYNLNRLPLTVLWSILQGSGCMGRI